MMRVVATLLLSAAAVILAVVLVATAVLPEPGTEGEVAAVSPTIGNGESADLLQDPWSSPIQVSGDRTGTVNRGESWNVGGDVESGFYLEQMVFDGLNIFPGPQDCPLEVEEISLSRGAALLRVDCTVTDITGNSTIELDGFTGGSIQEVLPPPSSETGGTLHVSGAFESEARIEPTGWYVSASDPTDETILSRSAEFTSGDASLGLDADGNLELGYFFGYSGEFGYSFNPRPGDCAITTGEVETLAANVERIPVMIDCPSVTSDSYEDAPDPVTVSVSGTILVDRITVDLDG